MGTTWCHLVAKPYNNCKYHSYQSNEVFILNTGNAQAVAWRTNCDNYPVLPLFRWHWHVYTGLQQQSDARQYITTYYMYYFNCRELWSHWWLLIGTNAATGLSATGNLLHKSYFFHPKQPKPAQHQMFHWINMINAFSMSCQTWIQNFEKQTSSVGVTGLMGFFMFHDIMEQSSHTELYMYM